MRTINHLRWERRINSKDYKRHLKYATNEIKKTIKLSDKFYVSWSGGKDSTAVLHLVKKIIPSTKIIIQFDDCDWPEKKPYVDRVSKKYDWDYFSVKPSFSVFKKMCAGQIGEDDFCSLSHDITKKSFIKPLEEKQKYLGLSGVFMGLRAEESRIRKIHLSKNKEIYRKKSGIVVCCPIARWSSEDVFAYLVDNNIEINPCYFYNLFKKPEDIRLSWAVPTPSGLSHGELEHLKKYNPRQFIKLKQAGFF